MFKAVKTTILVDCLTAGFLDIYCSITQPHDSKLGWQVLLRNIGVTGILTADKGYDWGGELRTRFVRKDSDSLSAATSRNVGMC